MFDQKEYDKLYWIKNREKRLKQQKEWREKNRQKILNDKKLYYINHKVEKIQYSKEYYKENKNKIKEYHRKYYKTEEGKLSMHKNKYKRKAIGKNLQNTLTLQEWQEILQKQNNRCIVCDREFGEHLKPTKDHIIPLSKSNDVGLTKENTQALCCSCNSAKRNKIFETKDEYEEFKRERRAKYAIILKENE